MGKSIRNRYANGLRLLLLRHGEVASHRGNVSVTDAGLGYATDVGRCIGRTYKNIRLMNGDTIRTQQTAAAIAAGARESGAEVSEHGATHALRNPDIYVAGQRVNMVSDAAALAAQVSELSVEEAGCVPFFKKFFAADDRIKYWLDCESPSGETASMVASRLNDFARSFRDKTMDAVIIGVTHSPIIRSVAIAYLNADPGEPNWVAGVEASICADRVVTWRLLRDSMLIRSAESVAENR